MMRIGKISPLLVLALITATAMLVTSNHAADVCIGEGTFNMTSTATLSTPEGNFTIDFLFLITITGSDNEYNVTVLGKITNITGPPVLLQTRLPLFDFMVSTDKGEYRWSNGKVFAAVLMPLSSGTTYEMSIADIRASCIKSVIVDASGLGLSDVVTIGEGGTHYLYATMSPPAQSTRVSHGATATQTASTVTYLVTTTYPSGNYAIIQPDNAAFASAEEDTVAEKGGIERNVAAAIIALLASIGVGLLLYTLFT